MTTQKDPKRLQKILQEAAKQARLEDAGDVQPSFTHHEADWPIECTVGPGLEGAVACESKVGYVNGEKGALVYRGFDIFELAARSSFEEVSYLLLYGKLPTRRELEAFNDRLVAYRHVPKSLRLLMGFPVENMNVMGALRLGTNLMRQEFTSLDRLSGRPDPVSAIGSDEDSMGMERPPRGEHDATYEFLPKGASAPCRSAEGTESCLHLISGVATIAAAISRIQKGLMPLEPDPELGHAANYLYMLTGKRPDPESARIMDVALILHADHGMNASTFATLVVASTLSDIYFSIGSGIAALNGPLHGGANEQVINQLEEIGRPENVPGWFDKARTENKKIIGFGHRVYKKYDPRARVLGPLAEMLSGSCEEVTSLLETARVLEKKVIEELGQDKSIYPNVDFYSGLVYTCLGIPKQMFTPTFAVSRVVGWTARVLEYLENNRIFRPRAIYTGSFGQRYLPIEERRD